MLILGFVLASTVGVPSALSSAPAACNPEHQIFWGNRATSGSWSNNHGASEWITLIKRDLDPACTNHGVAWSTVNVGPGADTGTWAEVGFSEKLRSDGTRYLTWFSEAGLGGNSGPINEHTWTSTSGPCDPFPYDTSILGFRVQEQLGTSNWDFYITCGGGDTWHHVAVLNSIGFSTGTPRGETGRRVNGGNATGMADSRINLKYFDNSGSLVDWQNPDCLLDNFGDNNWQGHQDATTAYHVEQGSGSCT